MLIHLPCKSALADDRPTTGIRYTIEATLDPTKHAIEGKERIDWVNRSHLPVKELFFHLYLNAFRNPHTVFMTESHGVMRDQMAQGQGRIDVLSMRTSEGKDLLPLAQRELIPNDRTQMRVPLPTPIAPQGTITLEVRFRATLPPVFARSGYANDFYMVAQWYPKLAKHRSDGTWATFPYHGMGEFFADFADHELRVRTPSAYVIAGTGNETHRRTLGPLHEVTFKASRVHDVAWAAYPHFKQYVAHVGTTQLRIFAPVGYDMAVQTQLALLQEGLRYYGARYGAYPYDTLSVVIPPRGAEGAGAMEYPTLIVTSGPWFPLQGWNALGPPGIVAHELAHQWFYGLVASDEVRWPMLDEGLSEWAALDLLGHYYGSRQSALGWPLPSANAFDMLYPYLTHEIASDLPASQYTESEYGTAVYVKPAAILETVKRVWGGVKLRKALGDYARTQRFEHPTPAELYASFDAHYWPGFSRTILQPLVSSAKALDYEVRDVRALKHHGQWTTTIHIRKHGPGQIPVWIVLRHNEDTVAKLRWESKESALTIQHSGPRAITSVHIDPFRQVVLDTHPQNNHWPKVSDTRERRWMPWLLMAAQACLSMVGL